MKTCPVCQATLFDDMDVCYGCMHEFGPGEPTQLPMASPREPNPASEAAPPIPLAAQPVEESVAGRHARPCDEDSPRERREGVKPADFPWTVRFEMRSQHDPAESWAMELVPAGQGRTGKAKAPTASRGTSPSPRSAAGR